MRYGVVTKAAIAAFAALTLGGCSSMSMRAPPPSGVVGPTGPVQRTGAAVMVERNDTLNIIARRHGVALEALAQANNIPPPYRLHVGQILVLPVAAAARFQPPQQPSFPQQAAVPDRFVPAPAPSPGSNRVETLSRAAPIIATPAAPSAAPSRGGDVQSEALAPPAGAAPRPAPTLTRPESRVVAQPPPAAALAPARVVPDEQPATSVPARGARNFAWPVRGTIASDFGSKPGGLANDGINIAAAGGTPVRAAENGVVNYAGNELRGFGNLVLLRHADGWVTAYAHLEAIEVRTGAEVRRGQVIGRVGQTGNVTSPQLHFEIRRAGKPVNPHQVLAAQAASAER